MAQERGERSGIVRRDRGYWDRYLVRWLRTAAATFGVLVVLDALLIVLDVGVLPNVLVLAFPILGSVVNLIVAVPRFNRT
jgi:hypothetical protein